MTPKEALEEIQGTTETDWGFGFGDDDRYPMEYNLFDDDERFNIIYQALTELEELKRDVKRFMEIANDCVVIDGCIREYIDLRRKLSKVGKEE